MVHPERATQPSMKNHGSPKGKPDFPHRRWETKPMREIIAHGGFSENRVRSQTPSELGNDGVRLFMTVLMTISAEFYWKKS
jgi:hypothetical protein